MLKNFKFSNGFKDTHKTAKIFLTSNIYGTYIIAISTQFAHGLTCEFLLKLSISVQTYGVFSILA